MSSFLIVPPQLNRQKLNEWFPTLVRYLGATLMVVLVTASILGQNDFPSAYIAAAGMILYKTVAAANGNNGNDHAEKWSGLP